jgi:FAD/FMN-containing dehydrogenase
LDEMRHATETNAGLTFGPDPATHSRCTLGGMLGNNSCGVHSVMAQFEGYGARTSDNTESLVIVTYDGIKMKVGATSDEEYNRIINDGGRKAEIYKKLRDFRDKYADLIRKKFPKIQEEFQVITLLNCFLKIISTLHVHWLVLKVLA